MPLPLIIGAAIAAAMGTIAYRKLSSNNDSGHRSYESSRTERTVDDHETKRRALHDRAETVIREFDLPMEADELVSLAEADWDRETLYALAEKTPRWETLDKESGRLEGERGELGALLDRLER